VEKSDNIDILAKSLAVVQGKLEGAKKDSENTFIHNRYADLASVWDACRELLSSNGLCVVQASSIVEGRSFVLDTILLHESGQWISGQLSVPLTKEDPQGLGSAMTYARRYSLMAMVGICPEDDDAESATKREPALKKANPKQVQNPEAKPTFAALDERLQEFEVDAAWVKQAIADLQWSDVAEYLGKTYKVKGKTVSEMLQNLNQMELATFVHELRDRKAELERQQRGGREWK